MCHYRWCTTLLTQHWAVHSSSVYLQIHKDVVPYWIKQDPNAVPYVSSTRIFLIDSCTAWNSLHWSFNFISAARSSMLVTDNPYMTSAYFIKGQSQDLVTYPHTQMTCWYVPAARKTLAQEFKDTLIQTYNDIVYNEHASYTCQLKIYVSENGLTNRITADFLPDSFLTASSPESSHLFNITSTGPSYDRIKYLSLIMTMMCVARFNSYSLYRFWQNLNRLPTQTTIMPFAYSHVWNQHWIVASSYNVQN